MRKASGKIDEEGGTGCKSILSPGNSNAKQSTRLTTGAPVLEEAKHLTYTLFSIEVPKISAAKTARAKNDMTFSLAIKSALSNDGGHGFALNLVKFRPCEKASKERVAYARQVDRKIIS